MYSILIGGQPHPVQEVVLMEVSVIDFIGILFAAFTAGVAVGRFVEKINSFISKSKSDRHPTKD